jgi:hypothetical protein
VSVKGSINVLKKINEKMYPKLSADERFKMVIKTMVNGDEVQREKLARLCPRVTYSESDHAYTERMEASRDIVTIFIIQLLEYDKIISIMKILKGFNYKLQGFDLMKIVNEVQAFLLAFETFCEEHVGMASKDMIQAWYGFDERYIKMTEKIKHFIDIYQISPDVELKGIWLEKVFLNAWENRVKAW